MHISRVQITNFRNFRKLDVPLARNSVILGENKVGKSNFIFALRLLLDPSLPDSARQLRMEDFWDGLDRPLQAEDRIEISIDLTDFEDNVNQLAILADYLVEPEPMTARLTYAYQPKPDIEEPTRNADYEFFIYGSDRQENHVGSDVRRRIPVTVLHALRDAEGDLANWRKSPLRPLLEQATGETAADELEKAAEEVQAASEKVTSIDAVAGVADRLATKLTAMVGKNQALDTSLGVLPADPNRLIRSLRLFIDDGVRALTEASLGSSNLIYIALKTLELEDDVLQENRDFTFLAIEEPEAHLHPHLQRLIYREFLRERTSAGEDDSGEQSGLSVFLTTHSPHIASVSPLRSLVVLRAGNEASGAVGQSLAETTLGDAEVADMERYLDVTRGELLFARGVILVEGDAELFLMPALARSLGYDLDGLGISMCSVSGTHFGSYVKLLAPGGLDVPFAVLTDYDPYRVENSPEERNRGIPRAASLLELLGKEANDDGDVAESAEEHGIFLNDYTLEIDLFHADNQTIMARVLGELTTNSAAEKRAADIEQDHDEMEPSRLLKDIAEIGKGRYAQRLAMHAGSLECPEYIKKGIEHVVEQC